MEIFFVILLLCLTGAAAVDLASPAVFNPVFYANNYPDINISSSEVAARTHWLETGITAGLQGSSAFHTVQYLKRFPELGLGTNHTAAIVDYLSDGRSKGRLGYLEGGYGGRYTVSNMRDLFVSVSRRIGVVVDSVVWKDYEFLNAWDHGRELQIALTSPPYGECFNPTEAGGRDDDRLNSTNTEIVYVAAQESLISTIVNPAFWLQPGDHETQVTPNKECTAGSPAVNKGLVYKYNLGKTVTIGCGLAQDNCLTFYSQITIGGTWPKHDFLQFEAPTGYLSTNFTVIHSVDVKAKRRVAYNSSIPVLMSTPDGEYAMGAYAPSGQMVDYPITYGAMTFKFASFADTTNKWNVVFRKNSESSSSPYTLKYMVFICLGTLQMATDCLVSVAETYPSV